MQSLASCLPTLRRRPLDAEVAADPASDSEHGEFESESEASVASG